MIITRDEALLNKMDNFTETIKDQLKNFKSEMHDYV